MLLTLLPALGLGVGCDRQDEGVCFEVPTNTVVRDAKSEDVATIPTRRRDAPALRGGQQRLETQGLQIQGMRTQGLQSQGLKSQGLQVQGMQTQGLQPQGLQMQGMQAQGMEMQGPNLELGDLNGARFELSGAATAVVLHDGRLFADGDGSDALLDAELTVHSPAGLDFRVRVKTIETEGVGVRFTILADAGPVCAQGDEGVFVAGHWDEAGNHRIDGDEITYSCMGGVIAKCVDWGYAPWVVGADVHQSCTRLARADYCGDGVPWTLEGTTVDVYDDLGVQVRVGAPGFSFEAAWGEDGALCVNETRYVVEDSEGRTVRPACFGELPKCTSLAEAAQLGAVLVNESSHTPIDACE